jgi:hypothetical protein
MAGAAQAMNKDVGPGGDRPAKTRDDKGPQGVKARWDQVAGHMRCDGLIVCSVGERSCADSHAASSILSPLGISQVGSPGRA